MSENTGDALSELWADPPGHETHAQMLVRIDAGEREYLRWYLSVGQVDDPALVAADLDDPAALAFVRAHPEVAPRLDGRRMRAVMDWHRERGVKFGAPDVDHLLELEREGNAGG